MNASDQPLVSIVIPALNEEENIPRLEKELLAAVDPLPHRFEFILIDNCSSDRTGDLARQLCARDPRWRYIRFSRNFTGEMSITAGYHFAKGEAIIVLHSDLQDPPSVIPSLLTKWREGYDVVYGLQTARHGDPGWRNAAARASYKFINWCSDVDIPLNAGDFRLITRQVRDALDRCSEVNRYNRGLIAWLGFRQTGVPYERQPRKAGNSKLPFWPLVFFMLNAVTSFSLKPLRMFTFMGFGLLVISLVAAIAYALIAVFGSPVPGLTTIIVLLLAAIGINSLGIGVLGEYVGRTYAEVKRRPLYVLHHTANLDPKEIEDVLVRVGTRQGL